MMTFDIFLVGVGGQGILTIGEVLSEAAISANIPVNFYPSKGMAQRGGFVKAQLRLGRENPGQNIPLQGADMVIAMEQSEALKSIKYIKRQGDFFLYADIWAPTAVMLKKANYPAFSEVKDEILKAGAVLKVITPDSVPAFKNERVAENVFILGAILRNSRLHEFFSFELLENVIEKRWKKNKESNNFALHSGYQMEISLEG